MCGNGIRCFARYLYDFGLTKETRFTVETGAGILVPEIVLTPQMITWFRSWVKRSTSTIMVLQMKKITWPAFASRNSDRTFS